MFFQSRRGKAKQTITMSGGGGWENSILIFFKTFFSRISFCLLFSLIVKLINVAFKKIIGFDNLSPANCE